jgi:hypothetical protein
VPPQGMYDSQLERAVRFAGYFIGGTLFLVFGIEFVVSGVTNWVLECMSPSFGSSPCSGNQIWQILSPLIGGIVLLVLGIAFVVLAHRFGPSGLRVPGVPPPPP